MLFGKKSASCLVETDSDDIQREIINAALEGKAFRNAGEAARIMSIFSNGSEHTVQVSASPIGSVVAVSPVMMTAIDLPTGEVYQLSLIPGFEPMPIKKAKCRRK